MILAPTINILRHPRWGRAQETYSEDTHHMGAIALGFVQGVQAEGVLARGDADLVALARAFLYQPRWGWQAAASLGGQVQAQPAYWRCLPRQAQGVFGPEARINMR